MYRTEIGVYVSISMEDQVFMMAVLGYKTHSDTFSQC